MPERLTQDEARALAEQYGSQRAAARAYGVHPQTFRYWLDPEPHRERVRRRARANPEAERERHRRRWKGLSGPEYNRRLLQMRRVNALRRIEARNRRQEADLVG